MCDLLKLRDVIVSGLKANAEHAARSVSGGGSEKWLAGESRIAINWASPSVLPNVSPNKAWVEVEVNRGVTKGQRADMVVITVDDEWKQRDVLAICEFKAVENKANSYVAGLLQKLKRQLVGHHAAHPGTALVFGVVFAVWSPENAQRAGNINGSIELLDDFVFRLKGCIQTAGLSIAADGKFSTIFDKKTTGAIYPIWQRGLAVAIVKA